MQNCNVPRYGITEKLRAHWTLFRQLWTAFVPLAKYVSVTGGIIIIEWPVRCTYWHDRRVLSLLRQTMCEYKAIVAGCMYGLRPQQRHDPDQFLGKTWRLSTNSSAVAAALDKRCDHSHRHITVEGKETAGTSFYPPSLCEAVHDILGTVSGPFREENAKGV